MAWPYRTGLPTMNKLAKVIQRLGVKYAEVQAGILSPDQLTKIANLLECIADFLSDVPSHDPEG